MIADENSSWCDFARIENVLLSWCPFESSSSVHGLLHWHRVEKIGLWLADRNGADKMVVRLFALLHDSQRLNDDSDPGHGERAAKFAASLRGQVFDMHNEVFELLVYTCTRHTEGLLSTDVTIGTCWDADRLDLSRVGIVPSEQFMSTKAGKEMAGSGTFYESQNSKGSEHIQ